MYSAELPLAEVVHFDVITTNPTTGAVSDADSTPTFAVYEEDTDTAIISATNFTKRTSLTGNYRGTFTASSANGFEVGKWYSVVASATVNSVAGKCIAATFRVKATEDAAGYQVSTIKDGTGQGEIALTAGAIDTVTTVTNGVTVTTNNDKTGYALSAAGVDAILDDVVEGTTTFRQMLRLFASALGSKLSGAGTGTELFRDIGDTKTRITATVDSSGNRTAISLDLT